MNTIHKTFARLARSFVHNLAVPIGLMLRVLPSRWKPQLVHISYIAFNGAPSRLRFIMFAFTKGFFTHFFTHNDSIIFEKNIFSGAKMRLDVTKYAQRQFYLMNPYSPHIFYYMKSHLKEGDTFVDVGANVGYFTLIGSILVGARGNVYAFEPEPKNFRQLSDHVRANQLHNVTLFQTALSDKTGIATLTLNPHNEGGHTLAGVLAGLGYEEYVVPTTTLDDVLDETIRAAITLVKIDVEGFERSVLKGMEHTLQHAQRLEIICEIGNAQQATCEYMRSLGYNVYALTADGVPYPIDYRKGLKHDYLFSKSRYQ